MSRAKCHHESYENGGSLGVVSRLVRMNTIIRLCINVILLVVRVGIQSLEFFIELNALFSLSLLIRFYS